MCTIIQLNSRGLQAIFLDLTILLQLLNPAVICFQETHLNGTDTISLKGFSIYNTFSLNNERAAGGSSVLVKDQVVLHSSVPLTTDLQAVAVRVSWEQAITLCSIYIPPNDKVTLTQLTDLLPVPYMLMNDFNAHSPLWGSMIHMIRVKQIEDFLSKDALCTFNDGSSTFLHSGNGTYSSIDLTICDPSLLTGFSRHVHDDFCGSDHFPIILKDLFINH